MGSWLPTAVAPSSPASCPSASPASAQPRQKFVRRASLKQLQRVLVQLVSDVHHIVLIEGATPTPVDVKVHEVVDLLWARHEPVLQVAGHVVLYLKNQLLPCFPHGAPD